MSSFSRPIATSASLKRSVALAALIGAAMLVSPLTAARAENATGAPIQSSHTGQTRADATERKAETVEQRISNLHTSLKITPDEETNWNGVAQAMRDNAAKMEKLSSEKSAKDPNDQTAVDDLKTYERFAHAHFDGLKTLVSSFETLYQAMPDDQKHLADQVFRNFGHESGPSRG